MSKNVVVGISTWYYFSFLQFLLRIENANVPFGKKTFQILKGNTETFKKK